jgi:two-component system, NarL family, nitrate/nitrite response regulator NarL
LKREGILLNEPIDVLVVDDHPLFRQGVVHSLSLDPGFRVVGQCDSGEAALEMVRARLPHVVLLDVSMPGWGGIVSAEKLALACPASAVVMLTASEDKDKLLAALKAGARGYVLKGASGSELAAALRAAAAGEVYVTPSMAMEVLVSLTRAPAPDPLQELTERERQILTLIGNGRTNREIGAEIHLSEKTIKHYVTNIMQKLQVRSRVEAALLAHRRRGVG